MSYCVSKGIAYLLYANLTLLIYYPYDTVALWCIILRLILSLDIHPNPGPTHPINKFSGGFLSFCTWSLNTLSKDDFYRVTLLEAHNVEHKYVKLV